MTRHRNLLALLASSLMLFAMSLRAAPPPNEEKVEGTVIRVGDAKLVLVESSSGSIRRFDVAQDASISRNSKNAKLEDIAFGDFALVFVKDHEETPIATVIVAIAQSKLEKRSR